MGFDAAEDGFRHFLLPEGRDEAGSAARAEGEFLHRRELRDRRSHFRHRGAEPLAVLLGREDRDQEDTGALDQTQGVLQHAFLFENGGQ